MNIEAGVIVRVKKSRFEPESHHGVTGKVSPQSSIKDLIKIDLLDNWDIERLGKVALYVRAHNVEVLA